MDLKSLLIGFEFFCIAFIIACLLLWKYDLNRAGIIRIVALSALGHFVGGAFYYIYTIHVGSDSGWYFDNAITEYKGTGYFFAFFILGYLKLYLIGDSLFAAFLFFAALGFLGSVFYLLTYKILLDQLSNGHRYFLVDQKILLLPALLLLCWPSYFFWSAGLVKDSFAFVSISIFLFFFAQKKISVFSLSLLLVASLMGFFVRPYLLIIIAIAGIIFVLLGSKLNFFTKIGILLLIYFLFVLALPLLQTYTTVAHFSYTGPRADSFSSYVIRQQTYMNTGTSIPVPTHNPNLIIFFMPYMIFANLFLPLFVGARNLIGLIGSVENFGLVFIVYFFYKNRTIWKFIKDKIQITKFFMLFFLVGMSFLSLLCTNLGLAMREKMMYVPSFIMITMLIYAYRKIIVLQSILTTQVNQE